jgi:cysteinyl-tRNA synthetase
VSLNLFDSKTQSLREFTPIQPGKVGLYVCGPTVQSAPHVGHLRSAVAFDVLAGWMRFGHGLDVTLVRNVTDVDDKILTNAAEQGVDWRELALTVEQGFNEVYASLKAKADKTPHATDHIIDMIALVEWLVSRGHAYQADDGSANVFFDSSSWPEYGELTNQRLDNMEGEDVASHGRRRPTDFALWKAAKEDEPSSASWSSPWGDGRPGWHIECSAMTRSMLGEHFDIHGGGLDLRFPHHENELAQSRAAGFEFANYWMHNGLVTVGGQKMSKSLGNGVSVEELFAQGSALAVRYWLLSAHYRTSLDYSTSAISDAVAALARIHNFLKRANSAAAALRSNLPTDFVAAMDADLNVPAALAVLYEHVRAGNSQLDAGQSAQHEASAVLAMLHALNLEPEASQAIDELFADRVETLIQARADARAAKDFALADQIRQEISALGVTIEDTPTKTTWSLNG